MNIRQAIKTWNTTNCRPGVSCPEDRYQRAVRRVQKWVLRRSLLHATVARNRTKKNKAWEGHRRNRRLARIARDLNKRSNGQSVVAKACESMISTPVFGVAQ